MESYGKYARDILIVAVVSIISFAARLLVMALMTKRVGAQAYGVWMQVQTTVTLILGFGGLGLPAAMLRFWPSEKDRRVIAGDLWGIASIVGAMGILFAAATLGFAPAIAKAFFGNATYAVRFAGAIGIVWSLDFIFLTAYRAFRSMRVYGCLTVLDALVPVGAAAFIDPSRAGLFGILAAVLAVRLCMLLFFLLRYAKRVGRGTIHLARARILLSFGAPTILAATSYWIVALSDRYMIGYFLNAAAVGAYSAAYQLASISLLLTTVLGFVLPPALSLLFDEGRTTELAVHLRYSTSMIAFLVIPFVVGSSMLAKPLLAALSTGEIAQQSYFVVPLVALAVGLYGFYAVASQAFLLLRKTNVLARIWLLSAVLNAGLNLVAIPRFGLLGAAATTALAYVVSLALVVLFVVRRFPFDVDWGFSAKALISSGVMALAIRSIHGWLGMGVFVAVAGGVLVYVGMMLALRAVSRKELLFLRHLVAKK